MFRRAIANKFGNDKGRFQFRGHEIQRIEAFSDAVFAFAVTLLIVSLEVPKNFEELMFTMRGFFAFGISFLFLMLIWYEQNIFFRRYGLKDAATIVLNGTLIFLVLFYVYPLKFLFTLMFSSRIYGSDHPPLTIKVTDTPKLFIIYGTGFISIYLLFSFMYVHALKRKVQLQLTTLEIFETRTKIYHHFVFIIIGLLSVLVAVIISPENAGIAGITYFLIGPVLSIYYTLRAKKKRQLIAKMDASTNDKM